MSGLPGPGVAGRSRPCSPLDLVRSPAERVVRRNINHIYLLQYVRFAPVPAIFERVTRSILDLDG